MKNLILFTSILFLINCTTTSNFGKRKYTKGRVKYAPTTAAKTKKTKKKEKVVSIIDSQKSESQSQTIKPVLKKNESSSKEVKNRKSKSPNEEKFASTKTKKEKPTSTKQKEPTKAEKKAKRKERRRIRNEKEKPQIAQLARAILLTILGGFIAIMGISLLAEATYLAVFASLFSPYALFWFTIGVLILLAIYLI